MSFALWAGVECTVHRVGDRYYDQLERTGHAGRLSDIDHLRGLGVSAVRYPVLWERTAPTGMELADFSWIDERLARLRAHSLEPIVGLVHHGSGPSHTSLLHHDFAPGVAALGAEVARRHPWLSSFTPVNEPLTTARFSALYGHWYPHERSDRAFVRALLNQTRATVETMRAVRGFIPHARLVQTEDIGTTFASPGLARQAAFDNARRWLSLDLLVGRVDAQHPLYRYLTTHGAAEGELARLVDEPCPPDIIGVNYYVTSDRFLDEAVEHYPASVIGGNSTQRYADVEAVRARADGIVGHERVLRQVAERYRLPVAVTEVHLGAEPQDQVAWLVEAHRGAVAAHASGADVRAVTPWAVFGSYDWDSLGTLERGHYEPGCFDVRSGSPIETPLAEVVRRLSAGVPLAAEAVAHVGWWRRPERLCYRSAGLPTFGELARERRVPQELTRAS